MTDDDIASMARESDLLTTTDPNGYQIWIPENLEAFANLVAAAEREACAKLCDALYDETPHRIAGWQYGEAIRARGQE